MFTLNGYSQISFEKGYYITNSGDTIECLIKNIDWENNPTNFDYKLSDASEFQNANIDGVKEFGIYNYSRYIRGTVKIDKSSNNTNGLNNERNPTFVEEQLFLKVLIEGKANLYFYEHGDFTKYFYNVDGSKIEQLVYKKYLIHEDIDVLKENNLFKQQLLNDLKCSSIEKNQIENLEYKKNSLSDFFTKFNKCANSNSVNYETKVKKDLFNLSVRGHLNTNSLSLLHSYYEDYTTTKYNTKLNLGLGVEAELILPFNKNKWAVSIEPTYEQITFQKITLVNPDYIIGGEIIATTNYRCIEIPLTVRHYFFLDKNSKLFVNASYQMNLDLKSSIDFTRADGSNYYSKTIKSLNNLAFGVGYKAMDKFIFELRVQTTRNILGDYMNEYSTYRIMSLLFGYTLF